MNGWRPPSPSDAALAAITELVAPSRPGPLADAVEISVGTFQRSGTPAGVAARYAAANAPVPAGATVHILDGYPVVEAPLSRVAILPAASEPHHAAFRLAEGPLIQVAGGSGIPNGEWFVPVGITRSPEGVAALMAFLPVDPTGWVVQFDLGGADGAAELAIDRGGPTSLPPAPSFQPATLTTIPTGAAVVVGQAGGREVTVTCYPSHDMAEFRAVSGMNSAPSLPAGHQITCSTRKSTGSLDQRILAVGGTESGKAWRLTTQDLIARLDKGDLFYVGERDSPTFVLVSTGTTGTRYPLARDGRTNALLGLPKCRKVANPQPPD